MRRRVLRASDLPRRFRPTGSTAEMPTSVATSAKRPAHVLRSVYRPRTKAVVVPALDPMLLLCRAHGFPEPECEVEFALERGRKFRADYLFRQAMVIVEANGQIWKLGGHSSGSGLLRDYEKANLAQLLGYAYFQFTPQQIQQAECLDVLREVLQ